MYHKKANLFIIKTFLAIIFSVLCWYPIKHVLVSTKLMELKITDNWVFYNKTRTGLIGKGIDFINQTKTMIENRTVNYFPFYHTLNSLFYSANYNLNNIIYDNDIPIGLNSSNEYIFYNKENDFFYLRSNLNETELQNNLTKQISFFNELNNQNNNVSVNIYVPTKYELTTLCNDNLNNYINMFKEGLNKDIKVSSMEIKDIDEYKNKFFSTDHHWNINGALRGYEDIMTMLNKPYRTDYKITKKENVKYYGSIAKSSLSTKTYDDFYDIDLELNYKVSITDEKYKPRKITYSGKNTFFDYYVHYYNGQYGLVEFNYGNGTDNLLIFSDSYGWSIDYLIALHFNNTYVVNFKYGDYKTKLFDYNQFIKKNNITDVLFLYQGEDILFDQNNYKLYDRISW